MREANSFDVILLLILAIIWGSSFFNIKIASLSYDPITLALVRVIFAIVPLLILCKIKNIKIEAFSSDWRSYALIGLCNISIPFVLIALGTSKINSYLAAMLMSTTPLSGTILAHFFTKDKGNENVTTSTTLWSIIFLLPFSLILEQPWNSSPTFGSTISLLYLGTVATGLAWLVRFRILTVNGLVFQTQVAYLIPIFGVFFGYFLMKEVITIRVLISLAIIILGIYIVKKNNKGLV